MSPIGTTAVITAKPGSADAVQAALTTLGAATHAETGCIMWSLQRGLQDPNIFVTVEKWESPEALELHLSSDHIATVLKQAGGLLTEPPRIIPTEAVAVGDPDKNSY